ncbi:hypothetical protein BDZ45DRAFT_47378 [Acephala macrosclerotiorum]|nr:hypothetical protein BDZ45DRAFT_47378 [Acephala macrosclerotiorum]
MPHAVYGEQIHYAVDNTGDAMGNFNIGRGKFDLITWDEHHIQLWQRYMTAAGVWVRKEGMRGRKYAREQLRQRYHDRRFHDPYPEGKTGSRSMGPPLNVNFKEDDYSGPVPAAFRFARRAVLDKDKCYPETNIPLSADDIKIGAWKAHNPSAIRVVGDFLTGSMAPSMFGRFAEVQLDRIESAFFELGWRVNRNALQRANEDMRDGRATNAFGSRAWRQAPPIRVDRFKGEEIEELMRGMREDAEAAAGDGDEDDDSDNDRPAGPGGWQYGGDGGDGSNGGPDDSSDDDSDDDQPRRPSARGKRKARLQQRSEQIDSDSSDSSDDLPANPTNKRKKKGKAVDRRKQKKSNGRCQPTSFQYVRDSDDSDEKDLFVTDTRQSSPVVAGPSNRSGRVVRDRDEELARRLSQEEENAAAARALAQAPVEVLSVWQISPKFWDSSS